MNVTVDNTTSAQPFPKLMINPKTDTIILATGMTSVGGVKYKGTVVSSKGTNAGSIGQYAEFWGAGFIDFYGSVTLKND